MHMLSLKATIVAIFCAFVFSPVRLSALMAGSASGSPADSPEARLDTADVFPGVGAMSSYGTCTALSRHWLLTAAHCVSGMSSSGAFTVSFSFGGKSYSYNLTGADTMYHPRYNIDGYRYFDAALIYVPGGISNDIRKYELYDGAVSPTTSTENGTVFYLVGYGGSGYGDKGVSVSFSVRTRRAGENVVNSIVNDGSVPVLFAMDFDNPSTTGNVGGSLGNGLETTICAGDSGGPSFVLGEDGVYRVAGINSFGSGNGYFGDSFGGALVSSVKDWIASYADEWSKADLNASVDNWFVSPWYGRYYESDAGGDWIYSADHGWQYVWPRSTSKLAYIYDCGTDAWWFTSATCYPYFYSYAGGSWYYYMGGVSPKRVFYCYKTGSYVTEGGSK
jgi:hypothetical protein